MIMLKAIDLTLTFKLYLGKLFCNSALFNKYDIILEEAKSMVLN